jgi:hypothetical protein
MRHYTGTLLKLKGFKVNTATFSLFLFKVKGKICMFFNTIFLQAFLVFLNVLICVGCAAGRPGRDVSAKTLPQHSGAGGQSRECYQAQVIEKNNLGAGTVYGLK